MSIGVRTMEGVRSARTAWSRRPGIRRLGMAFPIAVALLALLLYVISEPAYFFLVRDYSVVENIQFGFYLVASVLSLLLARRLRAQGARLLAVIYLVGAAGLFLVAGEEVSWGQELWERIIPGFPDSEDLLSVNAQGETTLHNLHGVGRLMNLAFLGIAVYGVVSPFLGRLARGRSGLSVGDRSAVTLPRETLPSFVLAALFFATAQYLGLTGVLAEPFDDGERAFLRFQEVAELAVSFGILLHVWLLLTEEPAGRAGDVLTQEGRRPERSA